MDPFLDVAAVKRESFSYIYLLELVGGNVACWSFKL